MIVGVDVWVPDYETGGEKIEVRYPCAICTDLMREIYILADTGLCWRCYGRVFKWLK